MSKTIQILIAEPTIVKFGDREIPVHEISWLDLLAIAEQLSELLAGQVQFDSEGQLKLALNIAQLGDMIGRSATLTNRLLTAATNLSAEEVQKLPPRVALRLLDVALEVNLTEEFLDAGKGLAARLGAALGGPAKSAASSKA